MIILIRQFVIIDILGNGVLDLEDRLFTVLACKILIDAFSYEITFVCVKYFNLLNLRSTTF